MADKSVDETVHVPAVDTTVARSDRWEGHEERCCHMKLSGRQSLYFEVFVCDCAAGESNIGLPRPWREATEQGRPLWRRRS